MRGMPDLTHVDYDKLPATSKSAKGKEASQTPNSQRSPYEGLRSLQFKRKTACDTNQEQNTPKDHVAAMWKMQLLNGITPTQFGGNPADFPFLEIRSVLTLRSLTHNVLSTYQIP